MSDSSGLTQAPAPRVDVVLRLDRASSGALIARLAFRNEGTAPFLLWKQIASIDGQVSGDRFQVQAGNEVVRYVGLAVKLPTPRPEDFVVISPGDQIAGWVALKDAYALPKSGMVIVQYVAFNPSIQS